MCVYQICLNALVSVNDSAATALCKLCFAAACCSWEALGSLELVEPSKHAQIIAQGNIKLRPTPDILHLTSGQGRNDSDLEVHRKMLPTVQGGS
jgi:hypothetical protein